MCTYLLDYGFKVAHTAYSETVFDQADVVADTPVFVDYASLYTRYPGAKFVYLERPLVDWVLSIRRLLKSMRKQWVRDSTVFEDDIKRCFQVVFPSFDRKTDFSDDYLQACYAKHQSAVLGFFADRPEQLLRLSLTQPDAGQELLTFCGGGGEEVARSHERLPHVNKGRRITYWNTTAHHNKIPSNV